MPSSSKRLPEPKPSPGFPPPVSEWELFRELRAQQRKRVDKLKPEDEEDLNGKIIVITGANSGIGQEAVREFAKRGAKVVMACRDIAKAKKVVEDIKSTVPNADLVIFELDLGDLDSVKRCANQIKSKYDHIHILINNAGVYFTDGQRRVDKSGFEVHMGINHVGPFLFTLLLLDTVKKGSPAKILFTSSGAALAAQLDLDDIMLERHSSNFGPSGGGPYANSKLGNLLFCKELAKRLKGTEVTAYALGPGLVSTALFRHQSAFWQKLRTQFVKMIALSPKQGAQTIIYCSLAKQCALESGQMYRFNRKWDIMDQYSDNLCLKYELSEKYVSKYLDQ